ncbi:MAG: ATP-binding protein [Vicinamibacterales bacterium]
MHSNELSTTIAAWWRWLMAAAIVFLAILGAVAASQYGQLTDAYDDIERSEAVTRAVDSLVSVLVDAETGYRGYLLSGNPIFLEPYRGIDTRAREALVTLAGFVAEDPMRRDDLGRLSKLVDDRLLEMATNVRHYDDGDVQAAIAGVRSADGKRTMDSVRLVAATLKSEERSLTAQRTRQAAAASAAARGFGIAAVAMTLLLSTLGWALSRTMEQRRVELAAETIARLEAERDAAASSANLAQSESFNRSLLDSSADCIAVLSPAGEVSFLNTAGLRMLPSANASGLEGTPFVAYWPGHEEEVHAALRTARAGGESRFAASHADAGAQRWWDVIVTASTDSGGQVTRLVATARDITQQKLAEEERLQLLASERAARSEAERAARIKDDFVSTLSHELRTPLNAILGWVGVLRQDRTADTVAKAIDVIDRNSRRQSQMVDDLLDMGRILSGKMRLDVQRVDLATVIEEAILSAQPSADAKGVRLQQVLGSAAIVRGDTARLQQVVWNLLSNAVKFTPRGGQVQVTLRKVNSHVHLQVTDTGIGIAPHLLDHVFDRFRQADAATSRRQSGLGLGLSIVKSLVELHGGTVDVASDGEHQGTTFTVRLPLALATPKEHDSVDGVPAVPPLSASLAGLKVLVLDDEEDAREVVRRLLEDAGAEVTAAGSADAAQRLLEDGLIPDVVVSDVGMPDRDGYEFIRSVRHMPPPLATVPAAALTALARLEDRKRAMLSGFQTHLAKPVDPAELVAAVASLAGRTGRG